METPASRAGYLGPTSYSDILGHLAIGTADVLHPRWIEVGNQVIGRLRANFLFINDLTRRYLRVSQSAAIPAPFLLRTLDTIEQMLGSSISDKELAALVLKNTSRSFDVSPTEDGSRFHLLFSGDNLRFEIIGILCSVAGRAEGHSSVIDMSTRLPTRIEEMFRLSEQCIEITRAAGSSNDLSVWLLQDNMSLSTMIFGDCSKAIQTCFIELID